MNAEAIVDESEVVVPLTVEQITVNFSNFGITHLNQLSSDEVRQISGLIHDVQISEHKVTTGLKNVAKILNSKVINEQNKAQFEEMIEDLVLLSFNGYTNTLDGVYYSPLNLLRDFKNQQLHNNPGLHKAREFIRKRSNYYIKVIKQHVIYFNIESVLKTTSDIVPLTTADIVLSGDKATEATAGDEALHTISGDNANTAGDEAIESNAVSIQYTVVQ